MPCSAPQERHTTSPSIADSRVPPQRSHRSTREAQVGSPSWHAGQISTWRRPDTARTHGGSRLPGSYVDRPQSQQAASVRDAAQGPVIRPRCYRLPAMADDGPIAYDVRDGLAVISLSRPDKRNALDLSMFAAIAAAARRADSDPEVRGILV